MKRIILLSMALTLLSSCSFTGMKTVKPSGTPSIASGTEVAFSKVINPAFAQNYNGADIVTRAEFYAAGSPRGYMTNPPKDHLVFQVTSEGGNVTKGLGGISMGDLVFIPKTKGALIFELEQGDIIQLRGGTRVQKGIIGSAKTVAFIATSVTKL